MIQLALYFALFTSIKACFISHQLTLTAAQYLFVCNLSTISARKLTNCTIYQPRFFSQKKNSSALQRNFRSVRQKFPLNSVRNIYLLKKLMENASIFDADVFSKTIGHKSNKSFGNMSKSFLSDKNSISVEFTTFVNFRLLDRTTC